MITNSSPDWIKAMADMETGWDELKEFRGLESRAEPNNLRRYAPIDESFYFGSEKATRDGERA